MMENKDDNLRSIDDLPSDELKELTVEYEQGVIRVDYFLKKVSNYLFTGK